MNELVWTAKKVRCKICHGGKRIPQFGCWLCNGAGFYMGARLTKRVPDVKPRRAVKEKTRKASRG